MKDVKDLSRDAMEQTSLCGTRSDEKQAGLNPKVTATVTSGAAPLLTARTPANAKAEAVRVGGVAVDLDSEVAKAFVAECVRNIEGLKSDRDLREAWGMDEEAWARLGDNKALVNAIKVERERRVRSGEAAREAAQQHFAKAPLILSSILENETISPRHRIEAAKELRQVAGTDREKIPSGEKFTIVIDLGGDDSFVKEFNQPARILSEEGDGQ